MNIERLNIKNGGKRVPGFTGSDTVFAEVALRLGAELPASYIEFIKTADGGCPELDEFYPQGGDPKNIFGVNDFYSFANPALESIHSAIDDWEEALGRYALPIACDGGNNQIYLFLKDAVPSVWMFLHDDGDDGYEDDEDGNEGDDSDQSGHDGGYENGEEGWIRVKIANSFEEFIASLTLPKDL